MRVKNTTWGAGWGRGRRYSPNVLRNTKLFYKQLDSMHTKIFWSSLCNLQFYFIIAKLFIFVTLLWGVACFLYLLSSPLEKYNVHSQSLRHSTWVTVLYRYPKTLCSDCCSNAILNICMFDTLYTHRTDIPFNHTHMHNKVVYIQSSFEFQSERLYTIPA